MDDLVAVIRIDNPLFILNAYKIVPVKESAPVLVFQQVFSPFFNEILAFWFFSKPFLLLRPGK